MPNAVDEICGSFTIKYQDKLRARSEGRWLWGRGLAGHAPPASRVSEPPVEPTEKQRPVDSALFHVKPSAEQEAY